MKQTLIRAYLAYLTRNGVTTLANLRELEATMEQMEYSQLLKEIRQASPEFTPPLFAQPRENEHESAMRAAFTDALCQARKHSTVSGNVVRVLRTPAGLVKNNA